MKNWIIGIIVIIIIALGAWLIWGTGANTATAPAGEQNQAQDIHTPRTPTTSVSYSCDNNKTITATYYDGPTPAQPEPGQPPQATGSVDVSINGGATTTLPQTISADGARYSASDDSLTFWSKGKEALIMRNNDMDRDYTNCTQS